MKKIVALLSGVLLIVSAAALADSVPKYLKKVQKHVDMSDPIQAAVFEAIKSYPNGFADVLGDPYSEEEQQAYIDWVMDAPDVMNQGPDAQLSMAEGIAATAHHLKAEVPGTVKAIYYRQETVQASATTDLRMVEWTLEAPFAEAKTTAQGIFQRLDQAYGRDSKWMKSGTEDPALNPLMGSMTRVYNIKAGLGGADMVMVNVNYPHSQEMHDIFGGVQVQVMGIVSKF